MTSPDRRHIIFVIDRSGSITGILSDMQGGFDQFVTDQLAVPLETTASLYQFDTEHDQLFSLGEKLAAMPEDQRPGTVILLIATDGPENSSREYTKDQVTAMLAEQQEKYGWVVVYNGAGQDAFAEAGGLGIAAAAVMDFDATPPGHQGQLGFRLVHGRPRGRERQLRLHRRGTRGRQTVRKNL